MILVPASYLQMFSVGGAASAYQLARSEDGAEHQLFAHKLVQRTPAEPVNFNPRLLPT